VTRRLAFTAGLTLGACLWLLLAACTPPPPGATVPAWVDTAWELNQWMADHPVTDLDGRTILINDGIVRPPAGSTLRNGGLRRTVENPTRVFPHVEVKTANVTLSTLIIEGSAYLLDINQPALWYRPELEGQHGIKLTGATGTTIRAVAISMVWGDGIYAGSDSRDIDVEGLIVDGAGRGGIVATDVDGYRIDNALVDQVGLWMVNLEPHGAGRYVRNVTITRLGANWFGSRSHWLNAAGPTLDASPFDCAMTATISRPANLPWHNPGTRIAPCATGVRVKG
jgi:hypothetical protein